MNSTRDQAEYIRSKDQRFRGHQFQSRNKKKKRAKTKNGTLPPLDVTSLVDDTIVSSNGDPMTPRENLASQQTKRWVDRQQENREKTLSGYTTPMGLVNVQINVEPEIQGPDMVSDLVSRLGSAPAMESVGMTSTDTFCAFHGHKHADGHRCALGRFMIQRREMRGEIMRKKGSMMPPVVNKKAIMESIDSSTSFHDIKSDKDYRKKLVTKQPAIMQYPAMTDIDKMMLQYSDDAPRKNKNEPNYSDLMKMVKQNHSMFKSVLRQKVFCETITKGKNVIKIDGPFKISKAHTFATSPRFDNFEFPVRY